MHCLIKMTDDLIINVPSLKWNYHKPSNFFKQLISHMEVIAKIPKRSPAIIYSPKKKINNI